VESNVIEIDMPKWGEEINISPYSDVHFGSSTCDENAIQAHMKKRAALQNPVFFNLGDATDCVFPGDKRFTGGGARRGMIGGDNYLDEFVQQAADFYGGFPWALWATGNHEEKLVRTIGTNPGERILAELRRRQGYIAWGGYSGFLRLGIRVRGKRGGSRGKRTSLVFLYHHGAWGGMNKGLAAAKRWANSFDGWDFCLYGHNHQCHCHVESKTAMSIKNNIVERPVYIVNTGTFMRTHHEGRTTYSERKGYPPTAIACPLIKVTNRNSGMLIDVSVGDS